MPTSFKKKDPTLAAIFSFLLMGTGQIYGGEGARGVVFFIGAFFLTFVTVHFVTGFTSGFAYRDTVRIQFIFYMPLLAYWIFCIKDAYKIANTYNKEKELKLKTILKNEEKEKVRLEQIKKATEVTIESFTEELYKNYKLYVAEIITIEEFTKKKNLIINSLLYRNLTSPSEDFLVALIKLKEENVLDKEDINKIKVLIK